jgi:hypothetical protein
MLNNAYINSNCLYESYFGLLNDDLEINNLVIKKEKLKTFTLPINNLQVKLYEINDNYFIVMENLEDSYIHCFAMYDLQEYNINRFITVINNDTILRKPISAALNRNIKLSANINYILATLITNPVKEFDTNLIKKVEEINTTLFDSISYPVYFGILKPINDTSQIREVLNTKKVLNRENLIKRLKNNFQIQNTHTLTYLYGIGSSIFEISYSIRKNRIIAKIDFLNGEEFGLLKM